ncbi:tpr domain-containing protein [Diplodia corticola]|uniref:Tpr domain-containing protein n=1 Tax=Diplodia corticola TaxID=236234 RepID=A0A1J9S3A6_9PEZI|nr:tpr domain-containing protein [Diplodia corticola]OJD34484.1 tpr domain-containing protein [Diplodia corticola]
MTDAFLTLFRRAALPEGEPASSSSPSPTISEQLASLEAGDFESILSQGGGAAAAVRTLLGHSHDDDVLLPADAPALSDHPLWTDWLHRRLAALLLAAPQQEDEDEEGKKKKKKRRAVAVELVVAAAAALAAFVQSNVTGPPLPFASARAVLPQGAADDDGDAKALAETRRRLVQSLGADGAAAYARTPNVELLCLAEAVVVGGFEEVVDALAGGGGGGGEAGTMMATVVRWVKVRVLVMRQRLLGGDVAPSLQAAIYGELEALGRELLKEGEGEGEDEVAREVGMQFLLERASIHTLHGFDKKAREDLDRAARERGFEFALTGLLGKRTKFQEKETSQLVVLARSKGTETVDEAGKGKGKAVAEEQKDDGDDVEAKPKTLDLNDDTLLESISFTEKAKSSTDVQDESSLPPSLAALDPGNQPKLDPLDSIILLSLASSITNTSPQDGLTREETIPYATRALEGGSSNWQVYTQALLVRSRIEGYRARTAERGLLQLQALVDQIIADTAGDGATATASGGGSAATFLPRPQEEDSAPVSERLRYIFQLCTPTRWELESELAQAWTKMGGFRSALEIYERLGMWAEVALCWAATERDDKAKLIIRREIFHATDGNDDAAGEDEKWEGAPRDPAPGDAPRLYCILGDITKDLDMYEKAWEVSGNRYARAQRSLGRHYFAEKEYVKAANAYSASLRVNQLNGKSWFALGCALLELTEFERAVEAFTRVVQLDDTDAEAWSNLAAALLYLEPKTGDDDNEAAGKPKLDDEEEDDPNQIDITKTRQRDPQQHRRDALKALKRAAHLQFDNFRMWDNLLTVAASLTPPSLSDIITAQRRIIDLRGATDGERCVDAAILDALVRDVIALSPPGTGYDASRPGPTRMLVRLVDEAVVPLITGSRRLWAVVARLALWRGRPAAALDAHEKAWRAATASRPGWESTGDEAGWNDVVDATVELAAAYESLGPMERTEGLAAGSGEVVAKDWKFKARSAIKGICGRAKETWEGTEGWERLREALEGLKGGA